MSELRKAAQAALDVLGNVRSVDRLYALDTIDRLRAALAQPETAEPVAWEVRRIPDAHGWDGSFLSNQPHLFSDSPHYEVRPLYAHPPRDEWRLASEPPDSEREVLAWGHDESAYAPAGEWRERVFVPGQGFHRRDGFIVTHWRDVQPPTEGA